MATSNSYNYNVTAGDIVTEALGIAGVYVPGETIDSTESADTLRTLNMMLKAWQPRFGLWLNKEASLFFQNDQIKYNIGPTGDHCALNAVKTELASAAASGASSITIDASTNFGDTFDRNGIVTATTPAGAGAMTLTGALVTNGIATLSSDRKILVYSDADDSGVTFAVTGTDGDGIAVSETITGPNTTTAYSTYTFKTITAITISGAGTGNIEIGQVGDHIGVQLDSGSMQWTYIASALSTSPSIVTALTGAAAVDNHVYSYTTKSQRPIFIVEARLHKSTDYETPLMIVGRREYMSLSNKNIEGTPNQIYYDKQLTEGNINVWLEPNDMQEYIKFTGKFPIQDVDELTQDFEIAQEWYEPVAWNLAIRLFTKNGKPIDPMVKLMAKEFLDDAIASDNENTSFTIRIKR